MSVALRAWARPPVAETLVEEEAHLGGRRVVVRVSSGARVTRRVSVGGVAVSLVADASLDTELQEFADRVAHLPQVREGDVVATGWGEARFDVVAGTLTATTQDFRSRLTRDRWGDLTQLLWVSAAWNAVHQAADSPAVEPVWWTREGFTMMQDTLKSEGPIEAQRRSVSSEGRPRWVLGPHPLDESYLTTRHGDVAFMGEIFRDRVDVVPGLALPSGWAFVAERDRGIVEIRDESDVVRYRDED